MPCLEFAAQERVLGNSCREIWQNLPSEPAALRNAGDIEQVRQNERIRMANIMAQAFADRALALENRINDRGVWGKINEVLFIGALALVAAVAIGLLFAIGYGIGWGTVALLGL